MVMDVSEGEDGRKGKREAQHEMRDICGN